MSLFGDGALRAVRERLDEVERKLASLLLDQEVLLDKVHRWMQRSRARDKVDAQLDLPAPEQQQPATDPISARILARRARTPLDRTRVVPEDEA